MRILLVIGIGSKNAYRLIGNNRNANRLDNRLLIGWSLLLLLILNMDKKNIINQLKKILDLFHLYMAKIKINY